MPDLCDFDSSMKAVLMCVWVRVRVCVCAYVCAYVCACVRPSVTVCAFLHACMCVRMLLYVWLCMCVCVCLRAWVRECMQHVCVFVLWTRSYHFRPKPPFGATLFGVLSFCAASVMSLFLRAGDGMSCSRLRGHFRRWQEFIWIWPKISRLGCRAYWVNKTPNMPTSGRVSAVLFTEALNDKDTEEETQWNQRLRLCIDWRNDSMWRMSRSRRLVVIYLFIP